MCQTYRIAICDDLATDRNYLSSLCEIWGSHNSYHIQISEFTSAENFLFHYAEKKDFDILLLDIEMGCLLYTSWMIFRPSSLKRLAVFWVPFPPRITRQSRQSL